MSLIWNYIIILPQNCAFKSVITVRTCLIGIRNEDAYRPNTTIAMDNHYFRFEQMRPLCMELCAVVVFGVFIITRVTTSGRYNPCILSPSLLLSYLLFYSLLFYSLLYILLYSIILSYLILSYLILSFLILSYILLYSIIFASLLLYSTLFSYLICPSNLFT